MAFQFNWSPLIADTDRVRHMLTSSLNKSPKPPIIVDDIVVNELNLGGTPPSLEILEIGDLAEDRFRGIFKVKYEGDAYLTLKTRVQANPLNTFLSTKPGFASPSPLAAGSGLTIPLQITLSDIRLSGFVILVFSKQKGITLVFRNDPLESLKVSSTFDSIPFVRDYLQKTIEAQLRILFVEDLPAIIHRLSLRVFSSEFRDTEQDESEKRLAETLRPADTLSKSPEQDADGDMPLSMDSQGDAYPSFSQKNLLRLAALAESQRTLSLFTPNIPETVYRARTSGFEHNEPHDGSNTPVHRPTLSRIQSSLNTAHGLTSSAASHTSEAFSQTSRPSLATHASAPTTYTLSSGRSRPHGARKRKNRVVNLRSNKDGSADGLSDLASQSSGYTASASRSDSASASGSTDLASPDRSTVPTSIPYSADHYREREGEIQTPPRSPKKKIVPSPLHQHQESTASRAQNSGSMRSRRRPVTPRDQAIAFQEDNDPTPRASMYVSEKAPTDEQEEKRPERRTLPRMQTLPERSKRGSLHRSNSELSITDLAPAFSGSTGGILEQAWMLKMATEVAKKVAEEKGKQRAWDRSGSRGDDDGPPPAYVS